MPKLYKIAAKIERGNKLAALKLYRGLTGATRLLAKDTVNPFQQPRRRPGTRVGIVTGVGPEQG